MLRHKWVEATVGGLLALAPLRLSGQEQTPPGRVAVNVVLLSRTDYDTSSAIAVRYRESPGNEWATLSSRGGTVIVRRRFALFPNVILLSPEAAPASLAAAATTLAALIQRDGDMPSRDGTYRVPEGQPTAPAEVRAASKVLDRLRQAPSTTIAAETEGRIARIYLPGRQLQDSLRSHGRLRIDRKP